MLQTTEYQSWIWVLMPIDFCIRWYDLVCCTCSGISGRGEKSSWQKSDGMEPHIVVTREQRTDWTTLWPLAMALWSGSPSNCTRSSTSTMNFTYYLYKRTKHIFYFVVWDFGHRKDPFRRLMIDALLRRGSNQAVRCEESETATP
jgi:hypothetical protein